MGKGDVKRGANGDRDGMPILPGDPENITSVLPGWLVNVPPIKQLRGVLGGSLYKNAFFLMLNSASTALLGFFAWMVVTNAFDSHEVGIASAVISATSLIATLSLLGFSVSIVRFLPNASDMRLVVNSSMTVSTAAALVISFGFIAGLSWLSPSLVFLQNNYLYSTIFVVYILGWTASMLLDCVFIGLRKASLVLMKNLIYSISKIPLPMLFVSFGAMGVLFSWGISAYISLVVGFAVYMYRIMGIRFPRPSVDRETIGEMFHFSLANYIAGLLGQATPYVLPILIVNILGPESTAYYYIAWMIATVLLMIPGSVASSLLAESSTNPHKLRMHTIKAFKFTYLLLLPAIAAVCILSPFILGLFGKGYSDNAETLVDLLAVSSVIYAANAIYISSMNVKRRLFSVITINAISTTCVFAAGVTLMASVGLVGVAFGWAIGQACGLAYAGLDSLLLWKYGKKIDQKVEKVENRDERSSKIGGRQ